MIPLPICVQIVSAVTVAVAGAVAGKKILSDKKDE